MEWLGFVVLFTLVAICARPIVGLLADIDSLYRCTLREDTGYYCLPDLAESLTSGKPWRRWLLSRPLKTRWPQIRRLIVNQATGLNADRDEIIFIYNALCPTGERAWDDVALMAAFVVTEGLYEQMGRLTDDRG